MTRLAWLRFRIGNELELPRLFRKVRIQCLDVALALEIENGLDARLCLVFSFLPFLRLAFGSIRKIKHIAFVVLGWTDVIRPLSGYRLLPTLSVSGNDLMEPCKTCHRPYTSGIEWVILPEKITVVGVESRIWSYIDCRSVFGSCRNSVVTRRWLGYVVPVSGVAIRARSSSVSWRG